MNLPMVGDLVVIYLDGVEYHQPVLALECRVQVQDPHGGQPTWFSVPGEAKPVPVKEQP